MKLVNERTVLALGIALAMFLGLWGVFGKGPSESQAAKPKITWSYYAVDTKGVEHLIYQQQTIEAAPTHEGRVHADLAGKLLKLGWPVKHFRVKRIIINQNEGGATSARIQVVPET